MTDELTGQIENLIGDIRKDFSDITPERLNKRPSNGGWSAAQCLQHILRTNEAYGPAFKNILAKDHKQEFWEKISPFTATTGRGLHVQIGHPVIRKFKAPLIFHPDREPATADFISELIIHFESFKESVSLIMASRAGRKVLRSPVSKLITLHADDTCKALVSHAHRHIEQARKALS